MKTLILLSIGFLVAILNVVALLLIGVICIPFFVIALDVILCIAFVVYIVIPLIKEIFR